MPFGPRDSHVTARPAPVLRCWPGAAADVSKPVPEIEREPVLAVHRLDEGEPEPFEDAPAGQVVDVAPCHGRAVSTRSDVAEQRADGLGRVAHPLVRRCQGEADLDLRRAKVRGAIADQPGGVAPLDRELEPLTRGVGVDGLHPLQELLTLGSTEARLPALVPRDVRIRAVGHEGIHVRRGEAAQHEPRRVQHAELGIPHRSRVPAGFSAVRSPPTIRERQCQRRDSTISILR